MPALMKGNGHTVVTKITKLWTLASQFCGEEGRDKH